jgi:formylglycine-generating enzyme required for sulfatase activity
MGSSSGGITRTGASGSFTYSVKTGQSERPVIAVSFYDAIRFANWLGNGQGGGDTETGSYTLLGGTPTPSNGTALVRNASATIVLPNETEWYKAAYYAASTASYFDYPTASNTPTTCSGATATASRANCNFAVSALTNKGSYSGSASPYGTFDQGGNAYEWNETFGVDSSYPDCRPDGTVCRGIIGGSFATQSVWLSNLSSDFRSAALEDVSLGFRVAMVPEPGTGLLTIAGLLSLGGWRRARR